MEYVLDKYSGKWSWKITGQRAVAMISQVISEAWCGDGPDVAIIPDTSHNVQKIKWILERYPMEMLSKSVWQSKFPKSRDKKEKPKKIERLRQAMPGKQFRGRLLNFQKEGLDFLLKSSGNALLADEMGLGKTVQTLAYLATEKQAFPALVIAPLVILPNWKREIEKFLKKKSRNGRFVENQSPTSTIIRTGKSQDLNKFDFYIVNYDLLHKRLGDLSKLNIRTIVCDEVQYLRSKSTKKYSAVKKLVALKSVTYKIGLSGTPIYNHGSEIWPIVDILKPNLLGSFKEFCEYFCYVNQRGKAIEIGRASCRERV